MTATTTTRPDGMLSEVERAVLVRFSEGLPTRIIARDAAVALELADVDDIVTTLCGHDREAAKKAVRRHDTLAAKTDGARPIPASPKKKATTTARSDRRTAAPATAGVTPAEPAERKPEITVTMSPAQDADAPRAADLPLDPAPAEPAPAGGQPEDLDPRPDAAKPDALLLAAENSGDPALEAGAASIRSRLRDLAQMNITYGRAARHLDTVERLRAQLAAAEQDLQRAQADRVDWLAIRDWASRHGFPISATKPVPSHVRDSYEQSTRKA